MYDFAENPLKLQRAIAETTRENGGKTPDAEIVQARYIALGGKIVAGTVETPKAVEPLETKEEVKEEVKKVKKAKKK